MLLNQESTAQTISRRTAYFARCRHDIRIKHRPCGVHAALLNMRSSVGYHRIFIVKSPRAISLRLLQGNHAPNIQRHFVQVATLLYRTCISREGATIKTAWPSPDHWVLPIGVVLKHAPILKSEIKPRTGLTVFFIRRTRSYIFAVSDVLSLSAPRYAPPLFIFHCLPVLSLDSTAPSRRAVLDTWCTTCFV